MTSEHVLKVAICVVGQESGSEGRLRYLSEMQAAFGWCNGVEESEPKLKDTRKDKAQ